MADGLIGRQPWGDMLRRCARCTVCGHKGATLQHPGSIEGKPKSFARCETYRFDPIRTSRLVGAELRPASDYT
jgi:hypothetical protein